MFIGAESPAMLGWAHSAPLWCECAKISSINFLAIDVERMGQIRITVGCSSQASKSLEECSSNGHERKRGR